jgi:hypothetical protein
MVNVRKKDPKLVTNETFTEVFIFLYQYVDNVMFLQGHVE